MIDASIVIESCLNGSLEKLNDFTDISSNDDLNDIKFLMLENIVAHLMALLQQF